MLAPQCQHRERRQHARPRAPPDRTSRPESPAIARMPDQRGCNGKPLCQPSQPPHEYGPGIRPKDATDKEARTPRLGLWTKMRRSGGQSSGPELSLQIRSLADFITTTSESRFSVHTGGTCPCGGRPKAPGKTTDRHRIGCPRNARWIAGNGRGNTPAVRRRSLRCEWPTTLYALRWRGKCRLRRLGFKLTLWVCVGFGAPIAGWRQLG